MPHLVLELRAGDVMIVNGAAIRFRNKTRIELAARARFLFGKQIMPPHEATTPAKRIYFALQTAYIGTEEERRQGLAEARVLIADFKAATTSPTARAILDEALAAAERDECYLALRLARRIIRHEEAVLGLAPPESAARAQADGPKNAPKKGKTFRPQERPSARCGETAGEEGRTARAAPAPSEPAPSE